MIAHEQSETKGRFFINAQNKEVAELTYSKAGATKIIIDHTHVSENFRGKDYAKQLVFEVVNFAKSKGLNIIPLCPYAKVIISKYKELQ